MACGCSGSIAIFRTYGVWYFHVYRSSAGQAIFIWPNEIPSFPGSACERTTASLWLAFHSVSRPIGCHFNQPRFACVVPRTGITPIGRLIHKAATNRVVVKVRRRLLHDRIVLDHLRMIALLPKLVLLADLVAE